MVVLTLSLGFRARRIGSPGLFGIIAPCTITITNIFASNGFLPSGLRVFFFIASIKISRGFLIYLVVA